MSNYRYFRVHTQANPDIHQQLKALLAEHYNSSDLRPGTALYLAADLADLDESSVFQTHLSQPQHLIIQSVNFSWSILSAPAAFLAEELGAGGLRVTVYGQADAVRSCFDRAASDLKNGAINAAYIIGMRETNDLLEIGIFYGEGFGDMREIAHLATLFRLSETLPLNPDAVSSMQQILMPSTMC